MVRRFARPYAKAVMDVAGSPEAASRIREELAQFERARSSSTDLQELYANPGIELDAKLAITKTIAGKLALSEMTMKVLEVLLRNSRMNDLEAIAAALRSFVNVATNTVIAEVRSAHELSAEETAELRRTLEKKFGKHVDVEVTPDPELLAGFVARVGSEIYDASVAGKIDKFRESLG